MTWLLCVAVHIIMHQHIAVPEVERAVSAKPVRECENRHYPEIAWKGVVRKKKRPRTSSVMYKGLRAERNGKPS